MRAERNWKDSYKLLESARLKGQAELAIGELAVAPERPPRRKLLPPDTSPMMLDNQTRAREPLVEPPAAPEVVTPAPTAPARKGKTKPKARVAKARTRKVKEAAGVALQAIAAETVEPKRKPAVTRARAKPAVAKPPIAKLKFRTSSPRPTPPAVPIAALALPVVPEELVAAPVAPLPDPAPVATAVPPATAPAPVTAAPLPRSASLAPYRKGGLIDAIGFWLRSKARVAAARLSASKALAKRVAPAQFAPKDELTVLREENERLRLQIDGLMRLDQAKKTRLEG